MTHQVEGDWLCEGPRRGQVPFSARKFADFPSNHGLEFSPLLASSNKPFQTFYPPFASTGRHIGSDLRPDAPTDRRKTCRTNTFKAWREDFDIEQIRWGQAISQTFDPIFDSQFRSARSTGSNNKAQWAKHPHLTQQRLGSII